MNIPNDKSTSQVSATIIKFEGDWTSEQIEAGEAGEPYEIIQSDDERATTDESDQQ